MNERIKVILKQPILFLSTDGTERIEMNVDIPYLLSADTFDGIQKFYPEKIKSFEKIELKNKTSLEDAKSVLIWRSGGIGDLLFTFPYLPKFVGKKIGYVTMSKNLPIIQLSPHVKVVYAEPLEYTTEIELYDYYIILNNFIENNPLAETVNAYDIGEQFFGVKRVDPPFPSILNIELPKIRQNKKIHIAIAFSSSVSIRNVSHVLWWDLLKSLNPELFRVSVIGIPQQRLQMKDLETQVKSFNPKLEINCVQGESIQSIINIFLKADKPHILIGPDSGLPNLFGYHGLPVIGLFGPFPSHLRFAYYRYALGIDINSGCIFAKNDKGNCFEHGNGSCKLAVIKKELNAPCLGKIPTQAIVNGIYYLLKEVYNWGD